MKLYKVGLGRYDVLVFAEAAEGAISAARDVLRNDNKYTASLEPVESVNPVSDQVEVVDR